MVKQIKPYGMWPSSITPAFLSTRIRLEDVQWDSDGRTLLWTEGRSGAIGLVCQAEEPEATRDLLDTPCLRGGIGYGGGEFTVAHGQVVFTAQDGRLYRQPLQGGQPAPITPAFGQAASPVISPDGKWVAYVHTAERQDSLGLADVSGQAWPIRLAYGADFYMQPVWHPQGNRLAWIEWDHPNMPFDGTRLMLGELHGDPPFLKEIKQIAGGEDKPVFQPAFSPDGYWLSYIIEDGEWEKLVILNLENGEQQILAENGTFSQPAWVQGLHTYGWSSNSRRIYYLKFENGTASLQRVELGMRNTIKIDVGPYTWLSQCAVAGKGEKVALIASSPTLPTRIIRWEGDAFSTSGKVQIVKRSESENLSAADISIPQPITWKSKDGINVYGLYYPPTSAHFEGEGLPPAIIMIHGGPTSQTPVTYAPEAAFFTNRGYAYLFVNYRGSTGYGRTYRQLLCNHWGDLDVEDAVGGAQALIDQGLADPDKLVIKGGSAGGYTVLNALIRYPGYFKAGLCSYGVSNLFTLAMETHKFEERYLDSMVGPLPQAAKRYHDWSPIFHADHIQDPLALFQGAEDTAVPPSQSEAMVNSLQARHIPHIYRLYPGEGHGFRKQETLLAYYADIEQFLAQYVLFSD